MKIMTQLHLKSQVWVQKGLSKANCQYFHYQSELRKKLDETPDIFCCAIIYHRMDQIFFILFEISVVNWERRCKNMYLSKQQKNFNQLLFIVKVSLPVIFKNFPASVFAVQWINNLAVFDSVSGGRGFGKRLSSQDQMINDFSPIHRRLNSFSAGISGPPVMLTFMEYHLHLEMMFQKLVQDLAQLGNGYS